MGAGLGSDSCLLLPRLLPPPVGPPVQERRGAKPSFYSEQSETTISFPFTVGINALYVCAPYACLVTVETTRGRLIPGS